MSTEVLGTHFNVNAYKDDGHTAVTLLQGVVRVAFSGRSVIIKPGQQAVATDDVHIIKNPDLGPGMALKNGEFVMKSADLHSIMRQVARWYNIKVIYEGDVKPRSFTASIPRNVNLSKLLEMLRFMGVNFRIDGQTVVVSH